MFDLLYNSLTSHESKIMLKILQARIQQYVSREIPDVKTGFRKAEEPDLKLPTSTGSYKKAREFHTPPKKSTFASLTVLKSLTAEITINCGKFLKKWEHQTTPISWATCMQDKKQQLQPDMEQWTGSKLGKVQNIYQGCILSPCLFRLYAEYIMKNAMLDEAQARIKIAGRNINNLRYADDIPL